MRSEGSGSYKAGRSVALLAVFLTFSIHFSRGEHSRRRRRQMWWPAHSRYHFIQVLDACETVREERRVPTELYSSTSEADFIHQLCAAGLVGLKRTGRRRAGTAQKGLLAALEARESHVLFSFFSAFCIRQTRQLSHVETGSGIH